MNSDLDPAVSKAMARAIGHEPPFTGTEYEGIQDLHIRNSRDLRGLDRCSSLEILVLVACDPVRTEQLSDLDSLRSITVRDSGMDSVSGLSDLSLLSCYAPRNLIHDITSLMSIPRLLNLDLTGNPLSEESYRRLVPQLVEKGCRVILSNEFEWNLTRYLHAKGVPVSCYMSQQGYRLCRPGLKLTDSPEYAHPVVQKSDVESLFEGDPRRVLQYFENEDLIPFS
ncbi:hypothetical protein [Streptomyces sp. NBC_01217]|uniref:hypothetical protein n=1 Tax=Streptomyces sp. NBC_01217 TaxID=2903779 RepID=UPI002E13C7CE|nr:hypothetical protein OG507_21390 [Streptomyces sp. NBC_01217]